MLRGIFGHPFARFLIKKVIFYAIVTFVALTFVFLIPRLMPGDPVDMMVHPQPGSPWYNDMLILRENMREYFGLNKSLFDQYIAFWGQVFTLNLGVSYPYLYPSSVASIIMARLPYTLMLVIPVLFVSFFLGNWIGAKAAYTGGKLSEAVYFFSVFSNRLPSFWFGMVLVFILAGRLALFPAYGYAAPGMLPSWNFNYVNSLLMHYLLPFITLMIVYLGGWATGMRSMIIHEMDSGYVRYSEQLGFKKSTSMSYAKRNAILPQFTGLNLYFNALIGETAILEMIFGWPGVGRTMFDAVFSLDYPLIFGVFIVILVIVILGNFLIDTLYGFLDPRIRAGGKR